LKERNLKVYESPGPKLNIPRIVLQGKWLETLGYSVGDRVRVSYEDNRIIVEPQMALSESVSD